MKSVTIIIPSNSYKYAYNCIYSIQRYKTNCNYTIFLIHNGINKEINDFVNTCHITNFTYDYKFNYSKVNNMAVKNVTSEYILFLNDDTEILSNYWLDNLLEEYRDGIGAVGAVLLYKDGTIQSAGDSIGLYKYWHGDVVAWNNKSINLDTTSVDSITGACLLIKKSVFESVGGFNESYPFDFGDVELGIRLLYNGYKNIINPFVRIRHLEFGTRTMYNINKSNLNIWKLYIFRYKLLLKFKNYIIYFLHKERVKNNKIVGV